MAVVLLLGMSTASCSGLIEDIPDTSPTHSSQGSVSVPPAPGNTNGTPQPTSEPLPTATPDPGDDDPGPGPNPTSKPPTSSSCPIGKGPGDGSHCPRTNPSFLSVVTNAIKKVQSARPNWFTNNGNHVKVQYWDSFYVAVVNQIGQGGMCAIVDGGGEISVKSSNAFADQYHILISSGDIHWGPDSYRATCTPAWW